MEFDIISTQIMAVCGLISGVAAVVALIAKGITAAKSPNARQNERLDAIETRLEEHDKLFKRDMTRLNKIDEGNRVTQRAILALLAHGIDGNEVDSMRRAKEDLQDFLINQ